MELLHLFQLCCFFSVLVYASYIDVKTRTVPNRIYILLLLTGLITISLPSLTGFIMTGLPLLISALVPKTELGGGDVKFGAMCGFVLKGTTGLTALLFGLIVCFVSVPIFCKVTQRSIKGTRIPLIPFLSAGCVLTSLIIL